MTSRLITFASNVRVARLAVAAAAAIALATLYGNGLVARRVSAAEQEAKQFSAAMSRLSIRGDAAPAAKAIDVAGLDSNASLRAVFRTTARAGESLGVTVAAVAATSQAVGSSGAGMAELSLQLRGSYANTKLVLAEALDRYPALIVSRLSVRTAAAVGEVDTQLTLLLPAAGAMPRPARE